MKFLEELNSKYTRYVDSLWYNGCGIVLVYCTTNKKFRTFISGVIDKYLEGNILYIVNNGVEVPPEAFTELQKPFKEYDLDILQKQIDGILKMEEKDLS